MAKSNPKQTFDIMNHELVPLHEIISETEKKKVLESYNITPDQLPKILDSDPVCLSIDAKPGQIVKITRKSHTAKEAVAYRLVIESN
jgi:DNA-directed RNA polymerase subunit H